MFKSAKWAGRDELAKLTIAQKKKIITAIRNIRTESGFRLKVYILKGDEPNACACPIKEKNNYVVGITSVGVQSWTVDEITAVLAHEVGHLKYNHASRTVWVQFTLEAILYVTILATAFGLSFLLKAFNQPAYLGWFGIAPIVFIMAPHGLNIMRTHVQSMEFEADLYSAATFSKEHMISALKKLTGSDESHPELDSRINTILTMSKSKNTLF